MVRDEKKKNGEGAVGLGPREMTALGCYIRGVKITLKRKKPGRGKRPPKATHTSGTTSFLLPFVHKLLPPFFFVQKRIADLFAIRPVPTDAWSNFFSCFASPKERKVFIYLFFWVETRRRRRRRNIGYYLLPLFLSGLAPA